MGISRQDFKKLEKDFERSFKMWVKQASPEEMKAEIRKLLGLPADFGITPEWLNELKLNSEGLPLANEKPNLRPIGTQPEAIIKCCGLGKAAVYRGICSTSLKTGSLIFPICRLWRPYDM